MAESTVINPSILALDVGDSRIGVARAFLASRLPAPLTTLLNNSAVFKQLQALVESERAIGIVVGLPRGLGGQDTDQTRTTQKFGQTLGANLKIPLYWQDEAVTSLKAKSELIARGKPYSKGDVDALAATYILEDFLRDNLTGEGEVKA